MVKKEVREIKVHKNQYVCEGCGAWHDRKEDAEICEAIHAMPKIGEEAYRAKMVELCELVTIVIPCPMCGSPTAKGNVCQFCNLPEKDIDSDAWEEAFHDGYYGED